MDLFWLEVTYETMELILGSIKRQKSMQNLPLPTRPSWDTYTT